MPAINVRISIRDTSNNLVATIDPRDDVMKDAVITEKLGEPAKLSFALKYDPSEYDTLGLPLSTCKTCYYEIGEYETCLMGRRFIARENGDVQQIRANGQLWLKVSLREKQVELERKFCTVCNDTDLDPVNDLDVIITPAGSAFSGSYTVGTAANALAYLLDGTGWSIGTVDSTETRDFRTSQLSIYENIKKVSELWGGYLVWDSESKTVGLRDPATWATDSGYVFDVDKNVSEFTMNRDYNTLNKMWVVGSGGNEIFEANTLHSGTVQAAAATTVTLQNIGFLAVNVNDIYKGATIIITGGSGAGQERKITAYNASTHVATVETAWGVTPTTSSTYEIKGNFIIFDALVNGGLVEGLFKAPDVSSPAELLAMATNEFNNYWIQFRPTFSIKTIDLAMAGSSWYYETFPALGEMATLVDPVYLIGTSFIGIDPSVRVVGITRNVHQPWKVSVELGTVFDDLAMVLAAAKARAENANDSGNSSSTIIIADAGTTRNTSRADIVVPIGATNAEWYINRAVKKLTDKGGSITLLEGVFVISDSIELTDNVVLEGQGPTTTIQMNTGFPANTPAITNSDYSGGNSEIQVSSLVIDGDKTNQTNSGHSGIYFENVDTADIYGVYAKNLKTYGIWLKSCEDISVYNCRCYDNTDTGILLWTTIKSSVAGNLCYGNGAHGIHIYSSSNHNSISKNTSRKNSQTTNDVSSNIIINASDYNNVQDNICRKDSSGNAPKYGIKVDSGTGNMVTNNDLYDSGVTAAFYDGGTSTVTSAGNRTS